MYDFSCWEVCAKWKPVIHQQVKKTALFSPQILEKELNESKGLKIKRHFTTFKTNIDMAIEKSS
jgi:hypothetical protein